MRKPNEEADGILQNSAPHVRPLFLFLMLTGCRVSEAINLKWRDVDLEARWLVLRDTKNGTDRGVPIHRGAHRAPFGGDKTRPGLSDRSR